MSKIMHSDLVTKEVRVYNRERSFALLKKLTPNAAVFADWLIEQFGEPESLETYNCMLFWRLPAGCYHITLSEISTHLPSLVFNINLTVFPCTGDFNILCAQEAVNVHVSHVQKYHKLILG